MMNTLEQFRASKREIIAGNVAMPDHVNDVIIGDASVKSVYLYTDETWLAVLHDGKFHVYNQFDKIYNHLHNADCDAYNAYVHNGFSSAEWLPMLEFMANDALPFDSDEWGSDRQIDAENRFFEHAKAIAPHDINEAFEDWALKATTVEMFSEAMKRVKESL